MGQSSEGQSGGKFANGAMGSAFQYLFNDMVYGFDPLTGDGSGVLDSFYESVQDGWDSLQGALGLNPNGAPSKIISGLGGGMTKMWNKSPAFAKAPLVVAEGIVALPAAGAGYIYAAAYPLETMTGITIANDMFNSSMPPSTGVGAMWNMYTNSDQFLNNMGIGR